MKKLEVYLDKDDDFVYFDIDERKLFRKGDEGYEETAKKTRVTKLLPAPFKDAASKDLIQGDLLIMIKKEGPYFHNWKQIQGQIYELCYGFYDNEQGYDCQDDGIGWFLLGKSPGREDVGKPIVDEKTKTLLELMKIGHGWVNTLYTEMRK